MPNDPADGANQAEHLCLSCGLCCDGTAFLWVKTSAEEKRQLRPLLPDAKWVAGEDDGFYQRCPAFAGCCTIYADRPKTCRDYRCKTLISLDQGEITMAEAQARTSEIRQANRALQEAAGCSSPEEVSKLLGAIQRGDGQPAGPVPRYSFEMLILQRLIDLYIRKSKNARTMGAHPDDPAPATP